MVIEQTAEEIQKSQQLSKNAQLLNVRLLSAAVTRKTDREFADLEGSLEIEIAYTPKDPQIVEQQLRAAVHYVCRVLIEQTSEMDREFIRVECVLQADYLLRSEYKVEETELQAFQAGNVVFNCWPFFREFVQSSITRMNLPAPPIPMLRVIVKSENADLTKQNDAEQNKLESEAD